MTTRSELIIPEELAAGVADRPLMTGVTGGVIVDDAVIIVNLDVDIDDATAIHAAERARHSPRLLFGLRTRDAPLTGPQLRLAAALDTSLAPNEAAGERPLVGVVDPVSALAELRMVTANQEHAAVILGHVLRASEFLPIPDALDVESLGYSTLLGTPSFQRWLAVRGPRPLPPPPTQTPVLVVRDENGLHITLNRPERRNAYGAEVRDSLVEALRLALADDTITSILLDGNGPVFSAGGDLDEFGTTPDLGTAHLIRTRAGAARLVAALADRIEVRVHGSCVGAGIEVPAFASRVVAAPDTVFRLPEVSMGLIPGAGGCVSVPRRIGRWRAYWLCATGTALEANTAFVWGLIDEVL